MVVLRHSVSPLAPRSDPRGIGARLPRCLAGRYLLLILLCYAAGIVAPMGRAGTPLWAGDDTFDWNRRVRTAFKSITARECLAHVEVLASDDYEGRLAGALGGHRASLYIAREFAAMGLEPGGEFGGWFQPFRVGDSPQTPDFLARANRLAVGRKPWDPKARPLRYGVDFLPHSLSPLGTVSGAVAFCGYGVVDGERNDFGALDLEGKVVVLLEELFPPAATIPEGVVIAARHGAAGVVLASVREAASPLDADQWPPPANREPGPLPIVRLSFSAAEKILAKGGRSLRAWLRESAPVFEAPRVFLTIDVNLAGYGRNVIGLWSGIDPELKTEAVIVGAHFDHLGRGRTEGNDRLSRGQVGEIHHGADDNASGTAGLIELAEAFSSRDVRSKRTVVFIAFDAEERGLLGSLHYVSEPVVPVKNTRAMLNMDMISRNAPRSMKLGKMGRFQGLNAIVEGVAARFGISLDPDGMDRFMNRSDQWHFIQKGVPAVFIFGGMHPQYHTENDVVRWVNPRKMEAIAQLMFLCAYECANHEGTFEGDVQGAGAGKGNGK